MSRATGNLIDHSYHQKWYLLIGIYLSGQTNTTIPQLINFTRKLEDNDIAMLF